MHTPEADANAERVPRLVFGEGWAVRPHHAGGARDRRRAARGPLWAAAPPAARFLGLVPDPMPVKIIARRGGLAAVGPVAGPIAAERFVEIRVAFSVADGRARVARRVRGGLLFRNENRIREKILQPVVRSARRPRRAPFVVSSSSRPWAVTKPATPVWPYHGHDQSRSESSRA